MSEMNAAGFVCLRIKRDSEEDFIYVHIDAINVIQPRSPEWCDVGIGSRPWFVSVNLSPAIVREAIRRSREYYDAERRSSSRRLRAQLAKLVEAARDLAFCAEHMTPGSRTLNECAAVVRAVLDEIEEKK